MTKYQELVEDYQDTIDRIRAGQKRLARLSHEIDELSVACDEHADYTDVANLVEEAGELSESIAEDRACLDYEIQREYERVPFVQARNQGITGFYRLAGLNPL